MGVREGLSEEGAFEQGPEMRRRRSGKLEEQHSSQREQPAEMPKVSRSLLGPRRSRDASVHTRCTFVLTLSGSHDHLEGRSQIDPLFPDKDTMAPGGKWLILSHGVSLRQRGARYPRLQTRSPGGFGGSAGPPLSMVGLGPAELKPGQIPRLARGWDCWLL